MAYKQLGIKLAFNFIAKKCVDIYKKILALQGLCVAYMATQGP